MFSSFGQNVQVPGQVYGFVKTETLITPESDLTGLILSKFSIALFSFNLLFLIKL